MRSKAHTLRSRGTISDRHVVASNADPVAEVELVEFDLRRKPRATPAREIVERDHAFSGCEELVDKVAADEAGSAGYEDGPPTSRHTLARSVTYANGGSRLRARRVRSPVVKPDASGLA